MSRKNYRKIYEKHYGKIPVDEFGRSFHIHHRDGNKNNNLPENLQAVSLQEHYEIHLEQGDYWAALRLAQRLNMSADDISKLSSKTQKERIKNGTHNFLNRELASKAGKKGIQHVKDNGWSEDAIEKRTETMRRLGKYNNKMKEANTPESIKKRVQKRKENGTYCDGFYKHHKQHTLSSLKKMCEYFQRPFSFELLELSRKKKFVRVKPETVRKYLTEEEISNLWHPPMES